MVVVPALPKNQEVFFLFGLVFALLLLFVLERRLPMLLLPGIFWGGGQEEKGCSR